MLSKHYNDELELQNGIPPTSLRALSVYLLVVSGKYLIIQKGSFTCHLKLPLHSMKDH